MPSTSPPNAPKRSWVDDARTLIHNPKVGWSDDRPLAELIVRTMLAPDEVATSWIRDHVIVAALARGDLLAGLPNRQQEMAVREGIRGYLWLPKTLDDDFEIDGLPNTGDDIAVVSGRASVNRHAIMQRQRWAGLRRGRALGAEFKRSTARQYGWEEQDLYADRLATDLDGFFADEDAVEQFVVDIVPFAQQHERFKSAAYVTAPLHNRLRRVAEHLRRVPPYYPAHLTPIQLAEGRDVADYSPSAPYNNRIFKVSPAKRAEGEPALLTIEKERRVVLLGDPGSGKSTIARALVLRELMVSERAVAVYVSAPILARTLADSGDAWIAVLARCALGLPLDPPTPEDCRELITHLETSRHSFVVLDGIDEMFDPEQRHLIDEVIRELGRIPGRVLITSRVIGYRQIPGWRDLETLPLQASFEGLLQDWYGNENHEAVARAVAAYEASARIRALVASPVIAGIIAALAADPKADLESSEGGLYRQAVTRLSERRWKNPHMPARAERETLALIDAYSDAAWAMAGATGAELSGQWETVTSYRSLRAAGVDVDLMRMGELLVGYDATVESAEVDAPWIWLHRSFADYFVGDRLLQVWRGDLEDGQRLLGEVAQYSDAWGGAIIFAVGLATQAERDDMLAHLDQLMAEGDPGDVIGDMRAEFDTNNPAQSWIDGALHALQLEVTQSPAIWEQFEREPFPENVRTARALGELFVTFTERIPRTDDASLAVWVFNHVPLWRGVVIGTDLQASDELLDRCIDGEFGDWAAFNVAVIDPERADRRPDTRAPYASLGLRCAPYCGTDAVAFYRPVPDDEEALRDTIERFDYSDISEAGKVSALLDAVTQVDAETSDSTLLQVLLLRMRLGQRRVDDSIADGGALVTDDSELAALLVYALSKIVMESWGRFARVAFTCREAGTPLRSAALTPIPLHPGDEVDDKVRLMLLEWAAEEGTSELDAFAPVLDDADEHFIQTAFDRLGERARGTDRFIWTAACNLARRGHLHHWRNRLLELQRAEDEGGR